MKVDMNHPISRDVMLEDINGNIIEMAQSFDTESEMAHVILTTDGKRAVMKRGFKLPTMVAVDAHIPGARLVWKTDKRPVTKEEMRVGKRIEAQG